MEVTKEIRFSSIRKNRKAASPAVSMVIITAATVVLVLVSGTYAFQVLERQQAASEFDAIQKSILAFDDAVRDIAWDRGGSRTVRFTTKYGALRLIPNNESISISVQGMDFNYEYSTAIIKYYMQDSYTSFGSGYSSYILGDEKAVVSSVTDSLSQVLVTQESGFASIALSYRVRVAREGPSTNVGSSPMNYVDIIIIRLNLAETSLSSTDFNLVAKNVGLVTAPRGPYEVNNGGNYQFSVSFGESSPTNIPIYLDKGNVIFNLVVSDVRVST